MTLLVLEIKVPDLPRDVSAHDLWQAVAAHGFTFFSFYLTFALAGLFWFWHHISFHYISRVDGVIVWINLAFLMFVSNCCRIPRRCSTRSRFTSRCRWGSIRQPAGTWPPAERALAIRARSRI